MERAVTPAALLFVDVDGVLNNDWTRGAMLVDADGERLDRDNLRQLAQLINSTGARVVLSSTWRSSLTQKSELLGAMIDAGCPEDIIIGQTGDYTEVGSQARGCEICEWLDGVGSWGGWSGEYAVLDDMDLSDHTRLAPSHFVWVNPEFGLCAQDVAAAEAILRGEPQQPREEPDLERRRRRRSIMAYIEDCNPGP